MSQYRTPSLARCKAARVRLRATDMAAATSFFASVASRARRARASLMRASVGLAASINNLEEMLTNVVGLYGYALRVQEQASPFGNDSGVLSSCASTWRASARSTGASWAATSFGGQLLLLGGRAGFLGRGRSAAREGDLGQAQGGCRGIGIMLHLLWRCSSSQRSWR